MKGIKETKTKNSDSIWSEKRRKKKQHTKQLETRLIFDIDEKKKIPNTHLCTHKIRNNITWRS